MVEDDHGTGLTLKQELFVENYLQNGGKGTEAALAAGYSPNPETIRTSASQVLHHPKVRAYMRERVSGLVATTDEVMAELTAVAFAPWESSLKVKYSKTGEVVDAQIVLADKVRALELIGKYHGIFREKVDVSHEEVIRVLEYIKPPGIE